MAMTLRLTEEEAAALAAQAEREGRSQTEIVREAVMDYVKTRGRRESLLEVLDEELPRYAEALERLGQ
jgi:predicted transcriptional regulator